MARQMEPLSSVKPTVITLILSCIVAMTTECTSNVATTTLFLPIFASMVSNSSGEGDNILWEVVSPWPFPEPHLENQDVALALRWTCVHLMTLVLTPSLTAWSTFLCSSPLLPKASGVDQVLKLCCISGSDGLGGGGRMVSGSRSI